MTGLEIIKAPDTTLGEIADIISRPCPPVIPGKCDRLSCRECWLVWLTTGEAPTRKGPPDKRTAPDEEGLHPNLVEMYARAHRKALFTLHVYATCSATTTPRPSLEPDSPQQPLAP